MKLLLKDAKGPVAEILNMSPNDERVVEYINEAIEYMTVSHDWADLFRVMSFVTYNGVLTLPAEVVQPIKFSINGKTGQPYGKHYEYLTNGPGDGDEWDITGNNLVDIGESPTTFDVDASDPRSIVIFSDRTESYPFTIRIRGCDEHGIEVRNADGSLGETITWTGNADANGVPESVMKVTTNKFSKITQVIKPKSVGYITLATANADGHPERAVANYHPYDTNPSFRRFKIHGLSGADDNGFTLIKGLFRIGYTPVYHDDDALAINMITAIKLMCKALIHYEHDEVRNAASMEGIVERLLRKQLNKYDVADNLLDSEEGYGNGDIYGV